jgi:predicted ester cyclase
MTGTNESKLGRLFEDVWNGERPGTADELVHEAYLVHDRELAEEMRGPELYRALARGTREVFPDATFAVDDSLADGDRVALRWTMTGTHRGELFGVAATGREVELSAIEIDRFEDGELVETWTRSDRLGLMEQIDAIEHPGDRRG